MTDRSLEGLNPIVEATLLVPLQDGLSSYDPHGSSTTEQVLGIIRELPRDVGKREIRVLLTGVLRDELDRMSEDPPIN